jgi:hypothetical protein
LEQSDHNIKIAPVLNLNLTVGVVWLASRSLRFTPGKELGAGWASEQIWNGVESSLILPGIEPACLVRSCSLY